MTPAELSWLVEDKFARILQGVKGVGGVERVGGVAREMRIELQPDRLLALGITAADVNRQLRLTSADMAGGRGEVGGREQSIRTLAASRTVRDLKGTSIVLPGGRKVRLDDLATVRDTIEEPRTFARFDGRPVVAFAVSRGSGASDAEVAAGVERKIAEFRTTYPDVGFEKIDSSVSATIGSYDSAMHTLLEGAALAVLVVFLFLRDWRATLIAALALPLSVFPTFWAMDALGFTSERHQPARDHAGHRHPGRRRHRRDREHRPPHAARQVRLPCGDRGRRRDRPRGHRHHRDPDRGVRAGVVHAGDRRALLHPVRAHHRGLGVHVAAGRAADHADARRLLPARSRPYGGARGAGDARLRPARRLVGAPPRDHAHRRPRAVCRLARLNRPAAVRLRAQAGQCPHPVHGRARPRREARRHRRGLRPGGGPHPQPARGGVRLRGWRPAGRRQEGDPAGDADRQPDARRTPAPGRRPRSRPRSPG